MRKFWDVLNMIKDIVKQTLRNPVPIKMTEKDEENFRKAEKCWICQQKFETNESLDAPQKHMKVRDHDHLTGEFRGAAHEDCNIKLNYKNYKIPVFFHNGSGFDFHFIFKYVIEGYNNFKRLIAKSMEKITSFELKGFKFMDSYQHLPSSIDDLSEVLDKSNAYHYTLEYVDPI